MPGANYILNRVQKPARYVGGEWNIVRKNWESVSVKVAFAFPDTYEVGMSYLGLQILYYVVNSRRDALMERVFAPWIDMEKEMRERRIPLFSLESQKPVSDFDILAFTLQYEMTFTNVINMLDLAGLPLHADQRTDKHPLVIAGGPCAFNPEPLSDFIDLFVIGEGEEVLSELLDLWIDLEGKANRERFLVEASRIPGIYVPSLYEVSYKDGKIQSTKPILGEIPVAVTKRVVRNFDKVAFPDRPIVPTTEIIHDRIMLEIARGCTRGCRFCQAGMIYRPVREKSPVTLVSQARKLVANTGYGEISLTSLSASDYSCITDVVRQLLDELQGRKTSISLPSLRVDAFSIELAKEIQRTRRAGLTFAPEAGTQRLRDTINKGVTEEDLLTAVSAAFDAGWSALKLYFMIGLPTEKMEDIEGITLLSRRVLEKGLSMGVSPGRAKVTVSVSSFVPKAHTPFQWEPQAAQDYLIDMQKTLKKSLKEKSLVFHWHDPRVSFIEAVVARGDRRLGKALEKAWSLGCRFDGWSECFNNHLWQKAFELTGIEPESYAYKKYAYEDLLPWDHIHTGVSKKYLIREHQRAMSAEVTPDCRAGNCPGCGLCAEFLTEPELYGGRKIAEIQDVV
ncbi:MAG TPA: TIGR03960 family radical SAM protein [Desulfotomaculum sp.]|nr:TIGR03960 family radical SAM protein [Desulfotomaculum sp.]HBY05057.1 TIGR03960 family B12-binding radical SAM protein [Desulfotomaculum sp.]